MHVFSYLPVVVGRWRPERGREVCANRAVSKGEVLFQSRPFAAALCWENLTTHCSYCFLPLDASSSASPASRCGQSRDHMVVCPLLRWTYGVSAVSLRPLMHLQCLHALARPDVSFWSRGLPAIHVVRSLRHRQRQDDGCFHCALREWRMCDTRTWYSGHIYLHHHPHPNTLGSGHILLTQNTRAGEMTDTTSRMLLQIWHQRSRSSPTDAGERVRVARGPGLTAEEAEGVDAGSGEVMLPGGIHGLESLDEHQQPESENEEEKKRGYEEYIRTVLMFVEGEERAKGLAESDAALEADVQRAVRWLSILTYNQHSILCDLTGEMLGNMIAPEGSLFNHSCDANVCLFMGAGTNCHQVLSRDFSHEMYEDSDF